jgi:uncharacterized protein (DUF2141 family)
MKKFCSISFAIVLILFAGFTFAQNPQKAGKGTGTLNILLNGFNNDKGFAMISLCNSKEGYKDTEKSFKTASIVIKDGKAVCVFKDIPFDSYAVQVYHDENVNKKLDKTFFGPPTEQYGFSNNAWATFSSPKYEEALFTLNKTEMTINITVRFWAKKEQE